MTTDFSYGGQQIVASGPFKPSGKDMPVDARTRVESYADIASIPNPHIGLKITVKVDETNNNKMTDYIVKSLKANSMGAANSAVNEVVRYVDYLGVSTGGGTSAGTGTGLTTEQAQQLQTAYKHSQSVHVQASDIPSKTSDLTNDSNYATETFVTSKIAEAQLGGDEVDLSDYATKAYADNAVSTALDGHTFKFLTQAEYDDLETKNPLVEYHITDATDNNIDTSNFATDLSLTGTSLQLKNSSGNLIGSSITLPSGGSTSITGGNVVFTSVDVLTDSFLESGNAIDVQPTISVVVDKETLTVDEGSTVQLKISIDNYLIDGSDTTLTLSVNNSYCSVSPSTLTYNSGNYNTEQIVTVSATHLSSDYTNKNSIITINNSSGNNKKVNVTITNIDEEVVDTTKPTIILSTTTLSMNENETNSFTVKLDKTPESNISLNVSVNNSDCSINKSTLTFTPSNYSTEQTVTVTGTHYETDYTNKTSVITLSADSLTSKTVNVTITNIDKEISDGPSDITTEEAMVYWFEASEVPAGSTETLLPNKVSGIKPSSLDLTIQAPINENAYTGTWLKLDRTDGKTDRFIKNTNKTSTVIGTTDSYSMEYISYSVDSPMEGYIGTQAAALKKGIQLYSSSTASSTYDYMVRSNGTGSQVSTERIIPKEQINHIVLAYDHDLGKHYCYYNGTLVHEAESGVFDFGNFISFNYNSANSTSYVYMIKLYKKALTQDEVTTNYNNANISSIASPV